MIRACPSCGQKNRIPAARLADSGRCGACKAVLPPVEEPIDVDVPHFNEIIRTSRVPVLVDFWAAWCGPCRAAAPELKKLASEMAGRALILKVNTEEQQALAARYDVRAIPSFAVFSGGALCMQQPGLVDRRRMRSWLESASQSSTSV